MHLSGYFARLPWHRGLLRRQARELVAGHDLIICRLPAPVAGFVIDEASRAGKPIVLLVATDILQASSWLSEGGRLRARAGRIAARVLRRQERAFARRSAFVGVWGGDLLADFGPLCDRVEVCASPNIERAHLTKRDDTCTGSPIRILRVASLVPNKGPEYLIRAVAQLVAEHRDVVVDFVGPSFNRAYLNAQKKLSVELGLGNRIEFCGPRDFGEDLFSYYRQADIHVVSSVSEGIPRCIAEARAFCVPTVAPAVGGIPSVIRDEHDGLLVSPGDPDSLATGIRRMIEDGPLRRSIIANGFELAPSQTVEYHTERLARFIAGALEATRKSSPHD